MSLKKERNKACGRGQLSPEIERKSRELLGYAISQQELRLIIPGAMAGEPPHCVSGTDDYGITTTQCDNGTVTITNGKKGTATVCIADAGFTIACKEIQL
ncbi:hypothetical protein AAEU76_004513 [Salmonella enterica subsp. enterica serovar Wedding]